VELRVESQEKREAEANVQQAQGLKAAQQNLERQRQSTAADIEQVSPNLR